MKKNASQKQAMRRYNRILTIREYDDGTGMGYEGKKLVEFEWVKEGKDLKVKNISLLRSLEWVREKIKDASMDSSLSWDSTFDGELRWLEDVSKEMILRQSEKIPDRNIKPVTAVIHH